MEEIKIHYRAQFTVAHEDATVDVLNYAIRKAGEWLYDKYKQYPCRTGIIKPWLFIGGNLHGLPSRNHAVTTVLKKSDAEEVDCWLMKLEHPDSKEKHRTWRIEIGYQRREGQQLNVSVIVSHYLRAEYIGPTPALPSPSAPRIVLNLLYDNKLLKTNGSVVLDPNPIILYNGQGRGFVSKLFSEERTFPFILFNYNVDSSIPPKVLQKLLLGNVQVFVYGDGDVEKEVSYYFPKGRYHDYKVPRNAFRVYQPKIYIDNIADPTRHRFFILGQPGQNDEEFMKIFVSSLSRRNNFISRDFIRNYQDMLFKEREYRLAALKINLSEGNQDEYIALLEQELENQSEELKTLQVKDKENEDNLLYIELEREELQTQLRSKQQVLDSINKEFVGFKSNYDLIAGTLQSFSELPDSVAECLKFIRDLFPRELVVLKDAMDSAEEAEFTDIRQAWSLLWAIPNTLWQLYFDQNMDTMKIMNEFRSQTGYELTFSESSMTKSDRSIMKSRMRQYNGKEIDCSPHLKLSRGGKHLRVHFHADRETLKIVIGHCGDHLETAGTKRRKEA